MAERLKMDRCPCCVDLIEIAALIGNWNRRQASKGQCRAVPTYYNDSVGTRCPHSICNFPLSLFTRIE
jgi:hypothetical protein